MSKAYTTVKRSIWDDSDDYYHWEVTHDGTVVSLRYIEKDRDTDEVTMGIETARAVAESLLACADEMEKAFHEDF